MQLLSNGRLLPICLYNIMLMSCVWSLLLTGKVPSPEDVTVISQDMGLILKWNPPKNSTGQNFTYTAEYSGYQPFFLTVCGSTSSLSCDFTDMVSAFGVYDLRVRTEREGNSSDWIVKENISLDKITVISAPGVKLQSRKGEIEVNITGPTLKKSNLEELFNSMSYRIRYWIDGQVEKKELRAEQSRVMLQSLTPNVRYCVQVEILTSSFTEESKEKPSLPSNHTCILNTENDDVELWLILVVLLGSFVVVLVSVVLVFFACWFSYKGFRFLHPEAKLPEHFKQYLCERPKSSLFLAMQNSPQPEERYHERTDRTGERCCVNGSIGKTRRTQEGVCANQARKRCSGCCCSNAAFRTSEERITFTLFYRIFYYYTSLIKSELVCALFILSTGLCQLYF
uniref:Fibronectin type-III domain-containing protein n=1 Tax=Astyanax mexicanus TaxID=7994 RepID=A0A3B1IMM1_ASTMX